MTDSLRHSNQASLQRRSAIKLDRAGRPADATKARRKAIQHERLAKLAMLMAELV